MALLLQGGCSHSPCRRQPPDGGLHAAAADCRSELASTRQQTGETMSSSLADVSVISP